MKDSFLRGSPIFSQRVAKRTPLDPASGFRGMRAMLQSLDGVEFLDAHGESKDFCAEQNFSWPACAWDEGEKRTTRLHMAMVHKPVELF